MSLDSIKTKQKKNLPPPRQRSFLIPSIIILIVIAGAWLFVLKYNFKKINENNAKESNPTSQELNQAIDDLGDKLDELKDKKIFQGTSTEDNLIGSASSSSPTTTPPASAQDLNAPPLLPDQY